MVNPYRRIFNCVITFLSGVLLLAACGPDKENVQPSSTGEELSFLDDGRREDVELTVTRSVFYDVAPGLKGPYDESTADDGKFLSMQFYQGEPVQLWASAADRETGTVSVYMYRQDGTRETCIERIERLSGQRVIFRDSQGCCYSISRGGENDNSSIVKLDGSGQILYTAKIEGDRGAVETICELTDGRLAVLVRKTKGSVDYGIVLLDNKGKFTAVELSGLTPGQPCHIGTSEDGLLLVTEERLYRVGLTEGRMEPLLSFAQTAYAVNDYLKPVAAFCLDGDGKLEMLRADQQGGGVCEVLSLKENDESRQEIVLRGLSIKNNFFLKAQVLKFNSSSDKYRVVIEGPEDGDERNAYIARTGVELATGKGPDILECSLIESPGSLIEKGMLEDVAPLMESAGIKEEDYFPIAFDTWRTEGSIYGIRCSGSLMERTVSLSVLGDVENPDIETVADALLAYTENAVYDRGFPAGGILRELLEGSETLWGMVDWEDGTCDFGGDLFRKLLEAAKRYQYDARNNYPAICSYRDFNNIYSLYASPARAEAIMEGSVPVGRLFDDGAHPIGLGAGVSFAINANAGNKEGAWEFLQFLLSEEAQRSMPEEFELLPVKKSVFWAVAENEILNGPTERYGKGSFQAPLDRTKAEEVAALMENARALPYKTEDILEIILEEAQGYFDGTREVGQVADSVENRVRLYLQEHFRKD